MQDIPEEKEGAIHHQKAVMYRTLLKFLFIRKILSES